MEGEDLMGHLLRNRIIFVGARINDEVNSFMSPACVCVPFHTSDKTLEAAVQIATRVVASMLAMETLDETADIKLYINSQGGSASSVAGSLEEDTMAVLASFLLLLQAGRHTQ